LHRQVEVIIIRLFLVRKVWGSNPEQINFYHSLSTTHHRSDFEVWPLAQSRWGGDGHAVGNRSLV